MGYLQKNANYATVTKIRAVYGKRLKDADYTELMAKKSVSEVADYLKKNTYYANALANIDPNTVHRGFLELLLRRNLFAQYEAFCKFQRLDKDAFFRYQMVYSEIRELLRAILYMNSQSADTFVLNVPSYLIERASFSILDLGKAKTFPELLRVIQDTPYHALLKEIPVGRDERVNYTKCEIILRTYYLKWLLETVNQDFHGRTRQTLAGMIETQTDLINIINAYRMKNYFHVSADEMHAMSLPFYGRLSSHRIQTLYEARDTEAFLHALSETVYGKQIPDLTACKDAVRFEHELSRLRCIQAHRSLTLAEDAAVSLYSMMYLLENEMNNIISIIEGIRYGKSTSYIESLLVRS